MSKKIIRYQTEVQQPFNGDLHPVLQKIFANRGLMQPEQIERSLKDLIPFDNLKGIEQAVELLFATIKQQQRILVVGDFDADGATSTTLALTILRAFGVNDVHYLVPNRFEYGYGLTPEIVDVAIQLKPELIITVDNGISSWQGVAHAKANGIKVLVTDHHLPGQQLPDADAIVNPNQPGDEFPSKNLAGVGVIYYVMLALRSHLRSQNWFQQNNIQEPNMGDFLDLVALGTYADVVPLDKNNRILVYQGLQRIRAGLCRPGITALLEVSNRNPKTIIATDLGFALGPRLNAAGRLDDMSLGIECLLAGDIVAAREMAQILNNLNQERRFIEAEMQEQALQALKKLHLDESKELPIGLCIYDPDWHQGVIGILASRIKDRLHRPVIAFAKVSDDEVKGSARSVPGIHIRDILDAIASRHPELISKFGGHAMAAGLSLELKNYAAFSQAFDEEVRRHLKQEDLFQRIYSDGELESKDLSLELAELIREAGPWGQAFPEPIFDGVFNIMDQRLVGSKHLKLTLHKDAKLVDAIAFNVNIKEWPNHRCKTLNIAYRLDVNEFRGARNLQLILEHLEPV